MIFYCIIDIHELRYTSIRGYNITLLISYKTSMIFVYSIISMSFPTLHSEPSQIILLQHKVLIFLMDTDHYNRIRRLNRNR